MTYIKVCILALLVMAEMFAIHEGLYLTNQASDFMVVQGVLLIMVSLGIGGLMVKILFKRRRR